MNPANLTKGRGRPIAMALTALSTLVFLPAPAGAQDAGAARTTLKIEEVVVQARRVEESLQTAPVAVSAFNANEIQRMFAQDLRDVGGYSPNVTIQAIPGFRAASVAIRGVSQGDIPSSFDPAVAVVVDGFVYGHAQTSLLDMFDIEQIEILRGPQGTLFGKNTIGGVVNVRSKRPSGELGGDLVLRAGNYGRFDVRAALDFPIAEDLLAGRIAVLSNNSDGEYDNKINGDDANGDDVQAVRGKFLLTPNENFEALLTLEYEKDRSDTPPVINTTIQSDGVYGGDLFFDPNAVLGLPPGTLAAYPGRGVPGGLPLGDPHDIYLVDSKTHLGRGGIGTLPTNSHDFDIRGIYLNAEYSFPNGGTLTSITGYRSVDSKLYNDYLGEPVPIYATVRAVDRDTWSQELRFAADLTDNIRYVIGGYYQNNEMDYYNLTSLGPAHPFFAPTGLFLSADGSQETDAWGIFGEGSYQFTDRARLFVGLRYTDEQKDFSLRPLEVAGEVGSTSDSNSWDDITYRAGIDYQLTDDIFAYFSYSTGFKSGGYNEQASTLTAIGPFDEEKADSYELGVKSELFDQRLRLNAAVFHVKYDDLQLDSVVPEPSSPVGQESRVTNAGESTVWGVELEAAASLTDQFLVQASLGYLDAEYDSYNCALGNPDARPPSSKLVNPDLNLYDCSFLDPKRSPKWTGSLRADYIWPLDNGSVVGANVGVVYTDSYYNDTLNSSGGEGEDRTLLNASVRYTSPDDRWEVALWGQNLTDEEYQTTGLGVANLWSFSTYGPPRTYGIELSFHP